MSILLKGLKMPKGDKALVIVINSNGTVDRPNWQWDYTLIKGAEAIPVPDHGDLIEKPVLIDELAISEEPDDCSGCASYNSYDDFCCRSLDFQNMCKSIRTTPVVIPAERSEE